jgi:hypothetical protein
MRKTNFFAKYFKNISYFINSLLEKNLNKLNFENLSYLFKNNKIILTFVALFVFFISYLLLPTFYKQSDITKELKIELKTRFDLNFKLSNNIKYNFFPRPHFIVINSTIVDGQKEVSEIDKIKIYISLGNFFSFKNIQVKDLIIENANFNLNEKNYNFFIQLLSKNFKDGNLIIKNSNIFFKNSEDEVLFINKISKMRFYYEPKELKNIFYAENEIFNIPYSIETYFNNKKNKIFSLLNINLIKLKIENELSFKNKKKLGKSKFIFNKLKKEVDYQIENNNFRFHIFDNKDQPSVNFKGDFNFKPFYATLVGDLNEINFNYLFGSNAVIAQLLKTEIFNNNNINFSMNINAENVFDNLNFKNIILKSKVQDGLIDTDKTKFKWRNFVDFEILESLIFVKDGELVLDGKLIINVLNYNEIYKYLLTPKNYRNKINKIDLNFSYNFDQKTAELKDIKIDNKIDQNVNEILNNIILKRDYLQNKIYFKNLLNEAIKSYAG